MSTIIRFGLTALFFAFVFPVLNGVTVTSNLSAILLLALIYRLAGPLISSIRVFLAERAFLARGAWVLLALFPVYAIAFWLVPAIILALLAHLMPSCLHFNSLSDLVLTGLAMLILHGLTEFGGPEHNQCIQV